MAAGEAGALAMLRESIPPLFGGRFPANYQNRVKHFGFFSRAEMAKNKGKLLMLDIDFGMKCSLNCPYCFRRENRVDMFSRKALSFDELLSVIQEAKKLGLQTVKFCGAGEPLENKQLLPFLEELARLNTGAAIFTKGHVLGEDSLTRKYHACHGVNTAKELCGRLYKLKTSVLLAFASPVPEVQDRLVGNVKGYSKKRDAALLNLVEAGFSNENPTRLALCLTPIIKDNYDTIFETYVFARERNIYPLATFLMVSGKGRNINLRKKLDITKEQKISLFEKIYSYNLEEGIQTLGQLGEEGISPMPGGHPCNQIACGMYLTLNGTVLVCPWDEKMVLGSVRETPLKEIWEQSENFARRGTFNCRCPPKDGKTIPREIYSEVLERLEKRFGSAGKL
jgi:MoaA/NifB/PqqE/SkfB family radical SAM enzyme